MELIGLVLIIVFSIIFLKIFVNLGIFLITLPIKILAVLFSTLLVVFVLVPLGIVGGIAALIVAPFAILIPILPVALILFGLYLLFRPSKSN